MKIPFKHRYSTFNSEPGQVLIEAAISFLEGWVAMLEWDFFISNIKRR